MWYDSLEDKRMWELFEEISRIPRESGNEEGIRRFLLSWAKENGFSSDSDEGGNVFIYAEASEGYESVAPLAFQGHMDMVCVKKEGSRHDFTTDPIEIQCDGRIIRAKDTTLGADNGIAIAMSLALISDPAVKHGPIDVILTTSEETGLDGAFALDASKVRAKRMINIDSEDEGVIYIGCAGTTSVRSEMTLSWEDNPYKNGFRITVSGLRGGHSGAEIDKERGNAIKILARVLKSLKGYGLAEISGGEKSNVIPPYAYAVISTDKNIEKAVKSVESKVRNELKISDPGVSISLSSAASPEKIIRKSKARKVVSALFSAPHGVKAMSTTLKGIVDTSNNLAIVTTEKEKVTVINSIRSSYASSMENLLSSLETIYKAFGFKNIPGVVLPAWEPDPDSAFLKEFSSLYKKITGKNAKILAMHSYLECGVLNNKIPGMDSVSIGPNLYDLHSVNERMEASSAERLSSFLKKMVQELG